MPRSLLLLLLMFLAFMPSLRAEPLRFTVRYAAAQDRGPLDGRFTPGGGNGALPGKHGASPQDG